MRPAPAGSAVDTVARALKAAAKPVVLIGAQACRAEGLAQAARLQAAGVTVYCDTFVARQPRGAGAFAPKKMPYFGEMALAELEGVDLMVFAGTTQPVAFFAYPNRPSVLVPDGCATLTLAERSEDAVAGLAALADELDAPSQGPSQVLALPEAAPSGKQTAYTIGASIARHMPEGAIVCDDAVTSGAGVAAAAMTARPHEVLALTGGAIGAGLPLAIGAAVASAGPARSSPERRRLGAVHGAVALDDGAREPRRDGRRLRQQQLSHPQHRNDPDGRGRRRPAGRQTAGPG